MKTILTLSAILFCFYCSAQQEGTPEYYKRVFDAAGMQKPPVFTFGRDSLMRFYFNHFPAFDTVLQTAITKGDTAKYIRIYFSFYLDENGYVYDPQFDKVASTHSAGTSTAKVIKYFGDMKPLLNKAIKQMLDKMPAWRPGLLDGIRVKTLNYDYLQFWVGLSAPQ